MLLLSEFKLHQITTSIMIIFLLNKIVLVSLNGLKTHPQSWLKNHAFKSPSMTLLPPPPGTSSHTKNRVNDIRYLTFLFMYEKPHKKSSLNCILYLINITFPFITYFSY